jgi:hypothetical protein
MGGSEGVLSGPSEACSGSLGRKARSAVAAVRFLLTLDATGDTLLRVLGTFPERAQGTVH